LTILLFTEKLQQILKNGFDSNNISKNQDTPIILIESLSKIKLCVKLGRMSGGSDFQATDLAQQKTPNKVYT
jgi:hypothetical protein